MTSRDSIQNTGDALRLEKLAAGSIVEAAQIEELGQDLRREGADVDGGIIGAGGHAVAADTANLSLLELVVVAANPARILSLPLPHNWQKFEGSTADPMLRWWSLDSEI